MSLNHLQPRIQQSGETRRYDVDEVEAGLRHPFYRGSKTESASDTPKLVTCRRGLTKPESCGQIPAATISHLHTLTHHHPPFTFDMGVGLDIGIGVLGANAMTQAS